jgi:hypothetical protein
MNVPSVAVLQAACVSAGLRVRCNRLQADVFGIVQARLCVHSAGHAKQVVQLGGAAAAPALLVSLARDGELRTWDVARGACTFATPSQACSLVRREPSFSRSFQWLSSSQVCSLVRREPSVSRPSQWLGQHADSRRRQEDGAPVTHTAVPSVCMRVHRHTMVGLVCCMLSQLEQRPPGQRLCVAGGAPRRQLRGDRRPPGCSTPVEPASAWGRLRRRCSHHEHLLQQQWARAPGRQQNDCDRHR